MGSVTRNWPIRLDICTNQLELAIGAQQGSTIDEWLAQGFQASEHCENMINHQGLDPKEIASITQKIDHFKQICKTND